MKPAATVLPGFYCLLQIAAVRNIQRYSDST
jgi:hypothetical protein